MDRAPWLKILKFELREHCLGSVYLYSLQDEATIQNGGALATIKTTVYFFLIPWWSKEKDS